MYNNEKFHRAFDEFLKLETTQEGEAYTRDLVAGFKAFIEETGMMRKSPGIVVIAKRLASLGFEKKVVAGRTYWIGLQMIREYKPDMSDPVVRRMEEKKKAERKQRVANARRHEASKHSEEADDLAAVKARARRELAKHPVFEDPEDA